MRGETSLHILYQNMSNYQRLDSNRKLSRKSVQTILARVCVSLAVAVVLLGICVVWIYLRLVTLETQVWELKLTRCRVQFTKVEPKGTTHPEPEGDAYQQPHQVVWQWRPPSPYVKDERNPRHPSHASAHSGSSAKLRGARLRSSISNVQTKLFRDRQEDSDTRNRASIGVGLQRSRRQGHREQGYSKGSTRSACRSICRERNRLRIANFEGTFSQKTINNEEHYKEQCITRTEWTPDKEIKACRNQTFIIISEGTALPFYTPEIGSKRRRMLIDHNSGQFRVNKSGNYLIHFNITVVDATGAHFLALYVNDRAMLACPNGGFRCPHANDPGVNRYRICNIGGVLGLSANDVIQIRTMAPNMMVRLEADQKSFFRFVYLGKSNM